MDRGKIFHIYVDGIYQSNEEKNNREGIGKNVPFKQQDDAKAYKKVNDEPVIGIKEDAKDKFSEFHNKFFYGLSLIITENKT